MKIGDEVKIKPEALAQNKIDLVSRDLVITSENESECIMRTGDNGSYTITAY